MDELEKAAKAHGVADGYQMSRFLLWIGNECFEGREAPNFLVLAARCNELVPMFLVQDKDPEIRKALGDAAKIVSES